MRYLITGGAGFIGSHLCERLIDAGHEVICLDNFFTGRKDNVGRLLDHNDFEIVRHDVAEPIHIEVDGIFNLACPASPVHYQFNPVKTVRTSVLGAMNVLELAKQLRVRVVHASTSEVYGDPTVHPQHEDYWGNVNPLGPRACYDEGKRVAETLCYDYRAQHDVDAVVVRIFNTYGPRMLVNDGRVISNFVVQALKGEALTVYGDGGQTRSFCYVDDLVTGLVAAMERAPHLGPINLGNPIELTVRQLADEILALTASRSPLVTRPLPKDDPLRRRPDIGRAQQWLQWDPRTPLQDGLRHTIEYFDRLLKSGLSDRVSMRRSQG